MKNGPEISAKLSPNEDNGENVNRKLIRPVIKRETHPHEAHAVDGSGAAAAPAQEKESVREPRSPRLGRPRLSVTEQTHAENFYYQKQMAARTPMTLMLRNGETVQGIIEWYDRSCIKLTRPGRSSLLIYKDNVRYMHKSDE